jgi:methionyl-tRNA formyltransferase
LADVAHLRPGEIDVHKSRVLVGTATGSIQLGEVKPAGKKHMSAADWARGVRIVADELMS